MIPELLSKAATRHAHAYLRHKVGGEEWETDGRVMDFDGAFVMIEGMDEQVIKVSTITYLIVH